MLLRFLQDLAADLECSAVFFSEVFSEEQGELQELLLRLGFFAEDVQLPLYEFSLSDVCVKKQKSEAGCVTLAELTPEQWKDFVRETDTYDFELSQPGDYEKDLSVFLVDDDGNVEAGLLFSKREEVLFAEAVAAYGSDEGCLINDLILWAREGAKKRLAPDTRVQVFLPARGTYRQLLMDATNKKAKKTGSLINYTYEVPV